MSPLLQALIMTVEGCSPRLSSIKVGKAASKERHLASRVRVSTVLVFFDTGKSLSEALIFASTNPQYDDRLFIELQV